MLNRPKLKHCFQSIQLAALPDIFLLTERNSVLLSDRLSELLIPLLNGHRTVDEIVDLLQAKVAAAEVYYALMWMEQHGYLTESDLESEDLLTSDFVIFCEHLKVDPYFASQQLQTTSVSIESFGSNLPTAEFKTILESLNIQVVDRGDLEIILTDDYLTNGLATLNDRALTQSRPWMLVKPLGTIVWIGPLFVPGKTGCWQCLAQRLQQNRPIEQFIASQDRSITPLSPLGSLATTRQIALNMAATDLFKWIVSGENLDLAGRIVTYDTLTVEIQSHILTKRPQCKSCGSIANLQPQPIVLEHCKKTFTLDGGHRCVSPTETLHKYQHHISPIAGIIRGLRKSQQDPQGLIHTYIASHHFATIFDDLDSLRQNISGRSAGKGRTDSQAKASGFCEAIERYSHVFQGDEIRQTNSYQQMVDRAIHPNACMQFSLEQYEDRHQWNRSCSGWFQRVPAPFDKDRQIDWTPVHFQCGCNRSFKIINFKLG